LKLNPKGSRSLTKTISVIVHRVDSEIEIVVGEGGVRRKGRVVWTREMPDGTIAGFAFIAPDLALPEGDVPPPSSLGSGSFEALQGAFVGEFREASKACDR